MKSIPITSCSTRQINNAIREHTKSKLELMRKEMNSLDAVFYSTTICSGLTKDELADEIIEAPMLAKAYVLRKVGRYDGIQLDKEHWPISYLDEIDCDDEEIDRLFRRVKARYHEHVSRSEIETGIKLDYLAQIGTKVLREVMADLHDGDLDYIFEDEDEDVDDDEDEVFLFEDDEDDADDAVFTVEPQSIKEISGHYDPNLSKADPPIAELVDALRTFSSGNKAKRNFGVDKFSALFYGPSGTGKSEAAKYLAWNLKLKLIHITPSDFLSKWIGESEHKIREAFELANSKKGMLLIDEFETFLPSRNLGTGFSDSLIGQVLVALDRFKGIMIATTNQPDRLDPALARRFTWKVKFDPIPGETLEELLNKAIMKITGQAITDLERRRLLGFRGVSPGDIPPVMGRLLHRGKVTNTAILDELERDLKFKAKFCVPLSCEY